MKKFNFGLLLLQTLLMPLQLVPFDCAAGRQGAHSDMRVFAGFAFMYVGWQCVGI